MPDASKTPPDGRLLRSERSREAIVKATYDLVGDGILRPTAEQVAEAAGVGIRTVFRHFSDMESLFSQMNRRLRETAVPLFEAGDRDGSLEARVCGLVRQRAALYERIAPYRRAASLSRWQSPFLQRQESVFVREMRDDLRSWLPELADTEPTRLEAIDLASSFEAWDRLRCQQRLGRARARETLERTLLALTRELG